MILDNKGINDKRLISNPIHNLNHELAEIDKIVPKKIIKENKIFDIFFNILKKDLILIVRVWT